MKFLLKASACAFVLAAFAPATASAQAFFSDFEKNPTSPATGNGFTGVDSADGWTKGFGYAGAPAYTGGQIELQYGGVAGDPAPMVGGRVFVELDSTTNSAMFRTISVSGVYSLDFLYSPRPGVTDPTSNGIQVLKNGVLLSPPGLLGGTTNPNTSWTSFSAATQFWTAGDVLTFQAVGNPESLGGYVDNIRFGAVPEPASWAMMIGGFGLIGGAMRRRRTATFATA